MTRTRRQWFEAAILAPVCVLRAARKPFWDSKDPASWSDDEKQQLLNQSPWAQEGLVRMEERKNSPGPSYGHDGKAGEDMPDIRPGTPPGGLRSVPLGGDAPPRAPNPDQGRPLQFRLLVRWESAQPVLLADESELREVSHEYYVLRLIGLPLMPPSKSKAKEEVPTNPNEAMLQAIERGSRLERKDKAAIPCAHLVTGSGTASTEVLLFFARGTDPIRASEKFVTLESWFAPFHVSVKFPLKEMIYRGELAL